MHVGGSGPAPQPALETQGQKCIPRLCSWCTGALTRDGGPRPWAREESYGKGGEEQEASSGQERSEERVTLRTSAVPWAAHTHKYTWGSPSLSLLLTHTHAHTDRCQNIHIRQRRTSRTYAWESPRGAANNKSSYNVATRLNKVQPWNITMEISYVRCKALTF